MRKLILAAAIAVIGLGGTASIQGYAQAPGVSVQFNFTPEQRTKIKTYVTEKKVKSVRLKERTVGYTIPEDVELVAVPAEWGPDYTRYRYVYVDDRVVLVEPSSRKIVYVID